MHPSHTSTRAQTGMAAAGAGACCSLTADATRLPPSQGLKVLHILPQPSGTNATARGQIPLHLSQHLGAAWPGQAGGHQGSVVPFLPTQPAGPSNVTQAKDRDRVSHSRTTHRHHPGQGRDAEFSRGREQGHSWRSQTSLTQGHTHAACLQPQHPLPPPTADPPVIALGRQAGKRLCMCPFRLTKYVFMLTAYSSHVNK